MDGIKLYFKFISILIRSQLQYRASFVMLAAAQFVFTFVDFMGVWVLFARFGGLGSWTIHESMLFFGIVNISFSSAECIVRGFDRFSRQVVSGEFDRTLLRPRSTVLQVMGHDFELSRLGRMLQGLVLMVWALSSLRLDWSANTVLLLLFAITGGILLFSGIMIIQATVCFWTVESLEIANILTNGSVETAQYPIAIYKKWFQRFFTYIFPLACISYFPGVALLGKADPLNSPHWVQWASPVAGLLFLLLSLGVWRVGVRHYCSTGS